MRRARWRAQNGLAAWPQRGAPAVARLGSIRRSAVRESKPGRRGGQPGMLHRPGMPITVLAPSERLAPFVRRFVVIEAEAEAMRTLLPEPGLMLGIRFRGSATVLGAAIPPRLPDATLTGLVGAARRVVTSAGAAVFAAFRETGAARFFA